jgi:MoxR-like ATPase
MQRILVIGSSGTAKSTLARQLGSRLGPPMIHPRTLSLVESLQGRMALVVLRTPREVRAFVDGLPRSLAPAPAEAA